MFYILACWRKQITKWLGQIRRHRLTLFFLHSVFESSFIWDGGSNDLVIFDRVTNSEEPSID